MNANLAFDFSVDKEKKAITVKREFDAALPLVWDAYTKKELLDQWWAPKPWKAKTKSMDFREGGQWLYAMVGPEGEVHWSFANYQQIVNQQKFVGLDGFSDEHGNVNASLPQSRWEISFQPKGDKTLVTCHITYNKPEDLENIIKMGFKEGFTMALGNLDEVLATLK